MENEPTTVVPEPTATTATKERMSKKQIIGMTILSLIAIAGVVFGVFGMTSQKQEIERLKIQITEAFGNKTELETDKITITDKDGTTTEITDTVTVANPEDYIYLSDWGIKIKISENTELFSLTHYDNQNGNQYGMITINSEQLSMLSDKYGTALNNGDWLPHNFIIRTPDSSYNDLKPVYNDGKYNYFVYSSSGAILTTFSESEANNIMNAAQDTKIILENPDNYSKI